MNLRKQRNLIRDTVYIIDENSYTKMLQKANVGAIGKRSKINISMIHSHL